MRLHDLIWKNKKGTVKKEKKIGVEKKEQWKDRKTNKSTYWENEVNCYHGNVAADKV